MMIKKFDILHKKTYYSDGGDFVMDNIGMKNKANRTKVEPGAVSLKGRNDIKSHFSNRKGKT